MHGQSIQRDNSGSMRKNDPKFLTSVAVRAFIEGLDNEYHVAIVAFDQQARILKPLAALDAPHRAALLESLSSINYRGLLTNSPAAIETSIYELRTNGRKDAEKSIIFMTDGIVDVAPEGADSGDIEKARWMKSTLADEAADRGVRIFGIAFTENADFELIQTLASRTEGEYYRAYSAADIDGVFTKIRDRLSASMSRAQPARPVNIVIQATPEPEPTIPTPPQQTTTAVAVLATGETASEAPTAAEPSLPEASANTALGDAPTNTELAESTLPVVALPQISLPGGGEQQEIKLPEVNLSDGTPPDSGTNAPELTADQATPPVVPAVAIQNPAQPPQTSEPDESKFYIALVVGAAVILLALASLIFVVMRRKPATALADALMPKAFLNDIAGSTTKQSYEVGAKPIVVGRIKGPDSEAVDYVVIEQSTISRRHALIEYKEHSFWVTDQNSLNGTFVNNGRTEAGVRLKHGDRIRFHKHEFEFLVLDMFETDRTMMSETVYADMSSPSFDDDDDDATLVRIVDDFDESSAEDPTITRT